MSSTSKFPIRATESVCPDWCMGHGSDGFQGWEEHSDVDGTARGHDGQVSSVKTVGVYVSQLEIVGVAGMPDFALPEGVTATSMLPAKVTVFTDEYLGNGELTPDEARELARLILAAVEQVESRNRPTEGE